VDDWNCKFDVPEVAWAANRGVAACFAALPGLKGAESAIHEACGDWCTVFVVCVWGLDFHDGLFAEIFG
jgi:hypothetical protein